MFMDFPLPGLITRGSRKWQVVFCLYVFNFKITHWFFDAISVGNLQWPIAMEGDVPSGNLT